MISTLPPAALEGFLRLVGVFLRDTLEHGLRRALDEVLGFLEAEAREAAHLLDDLDLLVAGVGEDDVEARLLLGLLATTAGAPGAAATATPTGAAAVTSNFSSMAFTSS